MNRYMIVIPAKNRSFMLKCDEGDGAKLETLQKLVSGYVETVPSALDATWAREEADRLVLLADEDGRLKCKPANQKATQLAPADVTANGKLAGVRFIETSEAKIWTGTGCPTSLAVFGTLVLAAHAYAVTEVEGGGLQHIVKQLGAGEDPLNQRASVGWKAIKTAERLCEQYMVRIESVSPKYSAKAKAN